MQKYVVRDTSGLKALPEGAVIGIEGTEVCLEVVGKGTGKGEFVDFSDKDGNVCRIYVRSLGKLPYGTIERRKW